MGAGGVWVGDPASQGVGCGLQRVVAVVGGHSGTLEPGHQVHRHVDGWRGHGRWRGEWLRVWCGRGKTGEAGWTTSCVCFPETEEKNGGSRVSASKGGKEEEEKVKS